MTQTLSCELHATVAFRAEAAFYCEVLPSDWFRGLSSRCTQDGPLKEFWRLLEQDSLDAEKLLPVLIFSVSLVLDLTSCPRCLYFSSNIYR